MRKVLLVAQHVCRHRYASAHETCAMKGQVATDDDLEEYVLEICSMISLRYNSFNFRYWLAIDGTVDETSPDLKRYLLSAAAWTNERALVIKLVKEGYNHHDGS